MNPLSFAQNNDKANPTFQKGQWALQFKITINFKLSSFQGSTISAKYHSSERKSIRFGTSLSGRYGYGERENFNTSSNKSKIETNSQSLTLNLPKIIYPASHKIAKLFYGYGPLMDLAHQFDKSKFADSKVISSKVYM